MDRFLPRPLGSEQRMDGGCTGVADGGRLLARLQDGRIQNYLRLLGAAVAALALFLLLGRRG